MFNNSQLEKLIKSLEKSKSYLIRKSESEASYGKLIDRLDSKIDFLQENRKLRIKFVSTSVDLVSQLKVKSDANSLLRSLYNFEAVSPFKNIPEVVNNCSAIFAVFRSNQAITPHHRKFIDLAHKKDIDLFILVVKSKSNNTYETLSEYLESQGSLKGSYFSLPIKDFVALGNKKNIECCQQILTERISIFQDKFIRDNYRNILHDIECFFENQNMASWRGIKQIKKTYLQEKEIRDYQQLLNKTFSKINQERQNKILYIKQKINQSKSEYLNPFLPNSWIFEVQQMVEKSQIKLVKNEKNTYLYLIVKKSDISEYLHSYILNLYQHQVSNTLQSKWSKINYVHDDGGLDAFVAKINQKIEDISIFKDSEIELPKITLDVEPFPELDLSKIVDSCCLKDNSKLVFDYNYAQSTWFKLLMSALIGITIYLVTKIYFGEGKYIGFFILFVQIINIFTGQSVKRTKLKSHKKELQRILNNKYQILIRLIVEQMTQNLIISLDRKNREYQIKVDAIAQLAQERLNQIQQEIEQHQSRKNKLKKDKEKIKAWFN